MNVTLLVDREIHEKLMSIVSPEHNGAIGVHDTIGGDTPRIYDTSGNEIWFHTQGGDEEE